MNRIKRVSGYCPEQEKEYTVEITYVDTSTLETTEWVKGVADCRYNRLGTCQHAKSCPIVTSAPPRF